MRTYPGRSLPPADIDRASALAPAGAARSRCSQRDGPDQRPGRVSSARTRRSERCPHCAGRLSIVVDVTNPHHPPDLRARAAKAVATSPGPLQGRPSLHQTTRRGTDRARARLSARPRRHLLSGPDRPIAPIEDPQLAARSQTEIHALRWLRGLGPGRPISGRADLLEAAHVQRLVALLHLTAHLAAHAP